MSEKKRPLPEPPTSPFGRRGRFKKKEDPALMADDIARAAAEGRLEELFGKEVPDNEQARALVSMMLGMTGMSSFAGPAKGPGRNVPPEQTDAASPPPEEVLRAVEGGDVAGLMGLLKKEHARRSVSAEQPSSPEVPERDGGADVPGRPAIEKEVIDGLIRIASDNDVTLEWLILRAFKVYVREYRETGRL